MKRRMMAIGLCLALVAGLVGVLPAAAEPDLPLTAISLAGEFYSQDFDSLAATGASSALPDGWAFLEGGAGSNALYTAGTGSSTTGDTYSFGAAGAAERALGGLRTGSVHSTLGAGFQNDTGAILDSVTVGYVCEQWRVGVANRGAADRMDFQYSTDATSLTTGTWIDADHLDCLSTNISDSAGAKDGNNSTYRTALSGIVDDLNIAAGATFWLRWTDFDIASSDDGLGIDDFSLEASSPSAVALVSFEARPVDNHILVTWQTLSEFDNAGFNLYRSTDPAGPQTLLAYVPSQAPGSTVGAAYSYEDLAVEPGQTYWYWLEDVSLSGATTLHGPVSATVQAPTAVTLSSVSVRPAAHLTLPWLWLVAGAGLALGLNRLRRRA